MKCFGFYDMNQLAVLAEHLLYHEMLFGIASYLFEKGIGKSDEVEVMFG